MPSKKYYELYKKNPEYIEKEKQRINILNNKKYNQDEEYREKRKEYQRNYNIKKKNHFTVSINQDFNLETLT
jgi:hypothetical protein